MALSWFNKLKEGLNKTSGNISEGFKDVFVRKKLDDDMLESLEEILISADIGIETALALTEELRSEKFEKDVNDEEVRSFFAGKIAKKMRKTEESLRIDTSKKPYVIMMVGVNGSGKTTTIGKLSKKLSNEGHKVMLAAGDTFRAGAVEQLKIWADRNNLPMTAPHKEGADPASVIFKAYEEAKEQNCDVLLADTAGRLQNRKELMDELEKVIRVLKKHDETAPHATLLVLDATVGQNAHMQTEAFKETADVTGLIMTKLDSTAKGGVLVALADKHNLPIHYIGIGEGIEDLRPFHAEGYSKALLGIDQ